MFGATSGHSVRTFYAGLLQAVIDAGAATTVVSSRDADAPAYVEAAGARHIDFPAPRNPHPLNDVRALRQLWRALAREKPDHCVWGSPKLGLLGTLACRIQRVPSTYVVHGLRYESAHGIRRMVLSALEASSCRLASDVIAVSEQVRAQMIHDRVASAPRIKVLNHGSAVGVQVPSGETLPSTPRDQVVVFVGRITRDKGLIELLEAWQAISTRHPSARLVLAGLREADALPGSRIDTLIESSRNLEETGHLSSLEDLYREAAVLVLPSYREGMPTVVLEAAVHEVPTITTNATGVSEAVVPDVTGIVVPVRDSAALAEAIHGMLSDPQRARRMGCDARQHVATRYASNLVVSGWIDYLDSQGHPSSP